MQQPSTKGETIGRMMLTFIPRNGFTIETVAAGESLFEYGNPSTHVFIVLDGGAKVTAIGSENSPAFRLACKWSVLGLSAVLSNADHSCSATAVVRSSVAKITRENLLDFLRANRAAMAASLDALSHEYTHCGNQ
jgi:CRP-like cAMP-binding protein